MSKSKFDKEYLKWLQQLDVEDDNSIWENIEDELDFIETWSHISSELDKAKPATRRIAIKPYRRYIAAAAAILLLIITSVHFLREYINPPSSSDLLLTEGIHKEKEKETYTEADINLEVHPLDSIQKTAVVPVPATRFAGTAAGRAGKVKPLPSSDRKENYDIVDRKEEYLIAGINYQQSGLPDLYVNHAGELAPLDISTDLSVVKSDKRSGPVIRISDIGASYSYKNTWLLNYETKNGLNPTKLGNTLLTFHQDMGVFSTIAFNDRPLIGLEFYWRSETGQNYQQYINASYVDRSIRLNYFKLQAYYIWNHRDIPGQTIAGAYVGKLKMAEDVQGMVTINVEDKFRNSRFGLLLGYQFNIPLKNKIFISPGLRVTYDPTNAYERNSADSNPFKKTSQLAACINIGVSYKFAR